MSIIEEDPGIEPGTTAPETAADSHSVLDKIKQRRDEREDILTIDIPSWDGDLKAKYQVLDRSEVEKMIRRVRARSNNGNSSAAGTDADCDFLIKACVGVVAYDADTDTETPVADGYTMTFARLLEPVWPKGYAQEGEPIKMNNERELVVYLFKWNNIALAAHGQRVARWMQDTSKPVEDPS